MAEKRQGRALVIGAGLAGLAAAYRLSRGGWEVLVLEKEEEVGGRCRTCARGGFQFDGGAQYFLDSYDATLKTAIEMGLGDRLRLPHLARGIAGKNGIAHFLPRSANPLSLLPWGAFGRRGPVDVMSVALPFVRGYRSFNVKYPQLWSCGDELTAREFLSGRVSQRFAEAFARPVALYGTGSETERISAAAFMVALRSTLIDRPGSFSGGMGSLPVALGRGSHVETGVEVREVVVDEGTAVGVRAVPGPGGRARTYAAEIVISAVPADVLRTITGGLGDAAMQAVDGTEYSPAAVVNFGFEEEVSAEAGPVLLPASEGFNASWVCTNRSKGSEYAPEGGSVVTVVYAGRDSYAALPFDDEAACSQALGDAARALRFAGAEPVVRRVDRHETGRPVASPGHARRIRRLKQEGSGVENLFMAGDWTASPTVEGAISSGFTAAGCADNLSRIYSRRR